MAWLEDLEVRFHAGDIFTVGSEAIACNDSIHLTLNYSLGRQLVQHCGPSLLAEIEGLRQMLPDGQLPLGHALSVSACQSSVTKHVILFAWWAEDNPYTESLIQQCLVNVLREALRLGVRSLALPLFGLGSGQVRPLALAKAIVITLRDLDRLRISEGFRLQELCLASDRQTALQECQRHVESRLWR